MLKAIKEFYDRHIQPGEMPHSAEDNGHELRLATAALLIEMTRADFEVDENELQEVRYVVTNMFGLSEPECNQLLELAEEQCQQAVCLYDFSRLVNDGFDKQQKIQVLKLLWRVALSDGALDKHEEYLVRKVADLIHVAHRDFIKARHLAMHEMGIGG
jgi:uncharacterized tellurite resistance protein B-like protein